MKNGFKAITIAKEPLYKEQRKQALYNNQRLSTLNLSNDLERSNVFNFKHRCR